MSILIAGTNSGSGKSTVTLGLLAALKEAGITVQPFKAGPDFIDPGLHTLMTGRISRNLDAWMCGEDYVRQSLSRHSADAEAAIIEGVMGLYDGGERSSAALAKTVGAKVILVVDAYGMAESAGALIKGFADYGCPIEGVIFNRVGSERHYDRLKETAGSIEVLGYLPREAAYTIKERHLGLTIAEEEPLNAEAIAALSEAVTKHINIKRIAEMAQPKADTSDITKPSTNKEKEPVALAIARDRAFCFYYEDNLDMLRDAGAKLVFFSPLSDKALPDNIDGIYIGGGYPEVNAGELAANSGMLKSIAGWVQDGKPLYAECGGLMYLGRDILTVNGTRHKMTGALPYATELMDKRAALGYREVTLRHDCLLGPANAKLRGHEFHYSKITEHEGSIDYNVLGEAEDSPLASAMHKSTLVSYAHLHLGSRPQSAGWFINFIKGAK